MMRLIVLFSLLLCACAQPIRINCGGGAFTDSNGNLWQADLFTGGTNYNGFVQTGDVWQCKQSSSSFDELYCSHRYFESSKYPPPYRYDFPGSYSLCLHRGLLTNESLVDNDVYDVRLHFSEVSVAYLSSEFFFSFCCPMVFVDVF